MDAHVGNRLIAIILIVFFVVDNDQPLPLAILGPTSCGKSDLAIEIADRVNGEMISVDSGAIYRDMNIGTATPSQALQNRHPHHLIDIITPLDQYSAGQFLHDAKQATEKIQARGKRPIFVGGTMLYFQTLFYGLAQIPPVSKQESTLLQQELETHGLSTIHNALKKADPVTAAQIMPTDKQRILRALSVYRSTGIALSTWQSRQHTPPMPLNTISLYPNDRTWLHKRIEKRLDNMWGQGLVDEVSTLLKNWSLPPDANCLRLIGYKQTVAYLRGEIDKQEMYRRAYHASCQFAKRQLIWQRRWRTLKTFDPHEHSKDDIFHHLLNPKFSHPMSK